MMLLTKAYAHSAALVHTTFNALKKDQRGVTAIEYALVAVAITGVVAAVFGSDATGGLGAALKGAITKVTTALNK